MKSYNHRSNVKKLLTGCRMDNYGQPPDGHFNFNFAVLKKKKEIKNTNDKNSPGIR